MTRLHSIFIVSAIGFSYTLVEKSLALSGWRLWAALPGALMPVLIAIYEIRRDVKARKEAT